MIIPPVFCDVSLEDIHRKAVSWSYAGVEKSQTVIAQCPELSFILILQNSIKHGRWLWGSWDVS